MTDAGGTGRPLPAPTPEEVEAREALILGSPPRIGPLKPEEFTEEALAVTGRLRQIGSGRPPPTSVAEVPEIVATMLRHPDLYGPYIDFGVRLGKGVIPFRERELMILRVAWLCQAPFEWGEHVKRGKQAGLTGEEIEAVIVGSTAPGWSAQDATLLRAVEELFTSAMISDETWAALAETLDDKQLIELPLLVGHYQGTAYSQNSLRVRLNDGGVGLKAR